MRSCSTDSARHAVCSAWLAVAVMLVACCGGRGPAPSELDPLIRERAPRPVLADAAEQSAARLAALALADDTAAARAEFERLLRSGPHTGLADNAEDLLNAALGELAYVQLSEQMLRRNDLDPALRLRLERYLDEQPLESAEDSLADNRRYKAGSIFNRAVDPLSRLSIGAALNPIETARSTVASIRVLNSFPEITAWERKALHEWEEYLSEYPDTPEAEALAERVERYRAKRTAFLHGKAMEASERAHEARSAAATLAHLDRADRLIPATARSAELRAIALQRRDARQQALHVSWSASAPGPSARDSEARRDLEELAVAVLSEPPGQIAELARAQRQELGSGPLTDELVFIEGVAARLAGEEDQFTQTMLQVATTDSHMARHARAILASLDQNPYGYYQSALRSDRRQRLGWVMFGRRSWRPSRDTFPMPIEALLELPGRVVSFVVFPIRLIRYRSTRSRFGDGVIATGERYLSRFPEGAHANEVNRKLESLYAQRGRWLSALKRHEAREPTDPARIEKYRRRIAERTLMAAGAQQRIDLQIALLRAIIIEYPETDSAEEARDALREAMSQASAQRIRVSRAFLLEFPELWGRAALGLRPELFDGEGDNGEIAEDGIFLLGRTYVEISLEGRDPIVRSIPQDQFARFIALLEEASHHQLATDEREQPQPDPQRDLFFERARLGLLDTADLRPTAHSRAEFLSTQEKHGNVMRRRNILPVELVLRGDLDHLGLAAFPRIRLPREEPDAFLYK